MQIKISATTESKVYQDALAIRQAVFVQEQHVPESREIDADEAKATYFVAYDENGTVLGTARLLPEDYGYHVQRVAVTKASRHHGVGKFILNAARQWATQKGAAALQLDAQIQAIGFYQALGYQLTDKAEFMDAGIRHREMRLALA